MIRACIGLILAWCLSGCALMPQLATHVDSVDESISVLNEAVAEKERQGAKDAASAGTEGSPNDSDVAQEASISAAPSSRQLPGEPAADEGPRFSLNVEALSADKFFRSLVQDTPFNMVVHPDVVGLVSLQLSNVTVAEVMNVMRDVYGYDYVRQGSVYQVYPDALRTRIFRLNYLNLARSGMSEVQVSAGKVSDVGSGQNGVSFDSGGQGLLGGDAGVGGGGPQVVGTIVNTQGEADLWLEVTQTLNQLLRDQEGAEVTVTPQVGLVVVRAKPAGLRAVENYLQMVEGSVSRQVILEAKIIEVTLNEGFQSGIDWNTFGDASGGTFRPLESTQADGTTVLVGGSEHRVAGDFVSGVNDIFNPLGTAFSLQAALGDFDATLSLLRTQGAVQVLSSPRIATVNNQKAVIKVGSDEFFVTDISTNTVTAGSAININDSPELTPFFSGIALDVTPQISSQDEVILHVHPTVSEVTEQLKEIGGQQVPLAASTIRESDSIVKARSGEIVVIGGLMQNSARDTNASVPLLGRIPLLGHLFRQKNQTGIKSELVILLKPVVVKPGVQQQFLEQSAQQTQTLRREFVR